MSLSLFPKKKIPENIKIVRDLDRLISTPIGVTLFGKTIVIKPMTTEHFLSVCQSLGELDALKARSRTTAIEEKEAVKKYHELFSVACEGLTKDDLMKMEYAQIGALFQAVLDCVNGKAQVQEEKKNLVTSQTPA